MADIQKTCFIGKETACSNKYYKHIVKRFDLPKIRKWLGAEGRLTWVNTARLRSIMEYGADLKCKESELDVQIHALQYKTRLSKNSMCHLLCTGTNLEQNLYKKFRYRMTIAHDTWYSFTSYVLCEHTRGMRKSKPTYRCSPKCTTASGLKDLKASARKSKSQTSPMNSSMLSPVSSSHLATRCNEVHTQVSNHFEDKLHVLHIWKRQKRKATLKKRFKIMG